jgi:hypothetical protein
LANDNRWTAERNKQAHEDVWKDFAHALMFRKDVSEKAERIYQNYSGVFFFCYGKTFEEAAALAEDDEDV